MSERKPISKKLRFDVFKRDFFKCQYCGATPPAVVLEVDHIHPVSQGGKDRIDNLITACFDCNRGKGAGLLSSIPESLADRSALVAEKLAQIKAFDRLIKATKKIEDRQIDEVEEAIQTHYPSAAFTDKFRESVRIFIQKIPAHEVAAFMHLACSRVSGGPQDAAKYFCGICWRTIKGDGRGR